MSQLMLENCDSHFTGLVEQALTGEEVFILRDNTPIARIIPLPKQDKKKQGGFGSGKEDILYMAEDFDAPLEDFKDYM